MTSFNPRNSLPLVAASLIACGDAVPTGPEAVSGSAAATATAGLVCETADLEDRSHGDVVTSLRFETLDVTLGVQTFAVFGGADVARAFDTGLASHPEDDHLLAGGGCPGCADLGNVLVVEDARGFADWGDSPYGGTFFLTGFPGDGSVRFRSVVAVSADDFAGSHAAFVDADAVAASDLAAGDVQLLGGGDVPVTSFMELVIFSGARGGFDELTLCREGVVSDPPPPDEPPEDPPPADGGEGCPRAFWRHGTRSPDAWAGTGYEPDAPLSAVLGAAPPPLARPERRVDPAALTLAQTLGLRGGGVNAALREGVAALLNAAHPDVAFGRRASDVIDVLSALPASRAELEALKQEWEARNDRLCPL